MSDLQIGIPVLTAGTVTLVLNTGSPDTLEISTATIWRSSEGVWAIGRGHDIVLFVGAATHTAKIKDVIWTGTAARVELRWLGARPSAGASGLAYELYQSTVAKSLFAAWIDNLKRVITKGDTTNPVTAHAFQGGGKRYAIEAAAGGLALRGGNDTINWPALPFLDNLGTAKAEVAGSDAQTFAVAPPTQAMHAVPRDAMSQSFYDVQLHHRLEGNGGDAAKINAAIQACPFGRRLLFPAINSPITERIIWNRKLSALFNGTRWRMEFGSNTDHSLIEFRILLAGGAGNDPDGGGDARCLSLEGLTWFTAANGPGNGTGGHSGIRFMDGAQFAPMLQSQFLRMTGSPGLNADGYAMRVDQYFNHWNTVSHSKLSERGVGLFGTDGWLVERCGLSGEKGVHVECASNGAFKTIVFHCTGQMRNGPAVRLARGSQPHVIYNSFEMDQSVADGAALSQIEIIPSHAGTENELLGAVVAWNNLGGSNKVQHPIRVASGPSAVRNLMIDYNTINQSQTGFDVALLNAGVIDTFIGPNNRTRGARLGFQPTDPRYPLRVFDSGTRTKGVWKPSSGITFHNGWSSFSTTDFMVDAMTSKLKFDGRLNAVPVAANTLVMTLPDGCRPMDQVNVRLETDIGAVGLAIFPSGNVVTRELVPSGTTAIFPQTLDMPVNSMPDYAPGP
jgi:hypothetical protein